jgi:hypothetical protein
MSIGGWIGPRTVLDCCGEKCWAAAKRTCSVEHVARHHTDWTVALVYTCVAYVENVTTIVIKFSRLNIGLQVSCVRRKQFWRFCNVSTYIISSIFRVNIFGDTGSCYVSIVLGDVLSEGVIVRNLEAVYYPIWNGNVTWGNKLVSGFQPLSRPSD